MTRVTRWRMCLPCVTPVNFPLSSTARGLQKPCAVVSLPAFHDCLMKAAAMTQYVFVMKGLSKTYPGGKTVLKDIWLSIYPGAKIGIVGVNGSGESTQVRIM